MYIFHTFLIVPIIQCSHKEKSDILPYKHRRCNSNVPNIATQEGGLFLWPFCLH